jgi:hypothetical protein
MTMAEAIITVRRKPHRAGRRQARARLRRRLASVLRRFLSGHALFAAGGVGLDRLPPGYFRFPPF